MWTACSANAEAKVNCMQRQRRSQGELHAAPTQKSSMVCMISRLGLLISSSITLTMLEGAFLHTYKRHKIDTDRVILWLVDNSR